MIVTLNNHFIFIRFIDFFFLMFVGWVVRVYHNFTDVDPDELENFFQVNDQVDLCNCTEIIKDLNLGNIFAMTWRWVKLLKCI